MEFVLTDKDKRFIDSVNQDLEAGEELPLLVYENGRNYYINFTCTDVAKANNFVRALMYDKNLNTEGLLGIKVNSFNYCHGDNKIGELKDYLREFIERLDHM